ICVERPFYGARVGLPPQWLVVEVGRERRAEQDRDPQPRLVLPEHAVDRAGQRAAVAEEQRDDRSRGGVPQVDLDRNPQRVGVANRRAGSQGASSSSASALSQTGCLEDATTAVGSGLANRRCFWCGFQPRRNTPGTAYAQISRPACTCGPSEQFAAWSARRRR